MIVFEGPDNAGKSTLAKYIAEKYGLAYFTAGPAPKNRIDLELCCIGQYARLNFPIVQDRLTCISQQIYHEPDSYLEVFLQSYIRSKKFVLVYCRPTERTLMDFSTHKIKSYDTEQSLKKIIDNQHTYINRYDDLMSRVPHLLYDWTDEGIDRDTIAETIFCAQMSRHEFDNFRKQLTIGGGF